MPPDSPPRDVVIIGGGIAGLSAAIYLGRALRDVAIIDQGRSMARWEPDVQNYLGFPMGVSGEDLLERGRQQAERYHVELIKDEIIEAQRGGAGHFLLRGGEGDYTSRKLLLATGIFHLPPKIPGVTECLGHSLFFCKDCDGYRVKDKKIAIYGANNEAVRYALSILLFSPVVVIVTDQRSIHWDEQHAAWLREYEIPVFTQKIVRFDHQNRHIQSLTLEDRTCIEVDVVFTTRGDVYYNELAKGLGAKVSAEGEIEVDADQQSSVPGLYAAGCVTPANCQMIIAAGQGAIAGQAINRALLGEDLGGHRLRRMRHEQLRNERTMPELSTDTR